MLLLEGTENDFKHEQTLDGGRGIKNKTIHWY